MMKRTNRSGFTLLELLIVVIIVGILASVALPRFTTMTKRARAAEAKNIAGAILTAEWIYYQDQDKFTAAKADLMVDYPPDNTSNFNYALAASASADATVTATGRADALNITVTAKIKNDGTRTITTTPAGL